MKKNYAELMVAYDKNGFVVQEGTEAIIRHDIDKMKVNGLLIDGSYGENFLLGTPAKKNILKIAWDATRNDDIDLIAQIGSPNYHEGKDIAQYITKDLGYKTIAVITPFYYHFTFREIRHYYDALSSDIDADFLIYLSPDMTHIKLTLDQYASLFENSKIKGVIYNDNDLALLELLKERFPNKIYYFAKDSLLLPSLTLKIDGCVTPLSNIIGPEISKEMSSFDNGNLDQALKLQNEITNLSSILNKNGSFQVLKLILQRMNVPAGFNRIPMGKPTKEQEDLANQLYQKYVK